MNFKDKKTLKPFLKWAGGKTQIISDINKLFSQNIVKSDFTYIEPFVGSGAVLFWVLRTFPNVKKAIINDINQDLINVYKVIRDNPKNLIKNLKILEKEFHLLKDQEEKKIYYCEKRKNYNERKNSEIQQASLFIFLNKTCFNGLYRVNKSNEFNVPIGSYKNPKICDEENLLNVSKALQKVEILCKDYEETLDYANKNTLFYFDPPYKPISETSNFNSYAKDCFDDKEQIRLRDFCLKLENLGHNWVLSNSDLKNKDSNNNFFDEIYSQFSILRVKAKRSINSKSDKRGELSELLITNNKNIIYA